MASIVIAEDEGVVAMDLEFLLKRAGYQVLAIVVSGEDVIDQVGKLRPDLVLMDIGLLGEIDGIEAARVVQERFGAVVVYLTAHTDADTFRRAESTGPLGYLAKPFEEGALRATLVTALGGRKQHPVSLDENS